MSVKAIKKELHERWADQPAQRICIAIVDFMERIPSDQLQELTYRTLQKAAGKDQVDNELLAAISILASSNISALEAHAWFLDENDVEHDVEPEELSEALQTGKFVHPVSGEYVSDFTSRIVPYYAASERFISDRD